jgi:hypothetical protein
MRKQEPTYIGATYISLFMLNYRFFCVFLVPN